MPESPIKTYIQRHYFSIALLGFMASFLLWPSSKGVNNVYYLLIGLPGLVALVMTGHKRALVNVQHGWAAAFLLWNFCIGVVHADLSMIKHVLYIAVFILVVARFADQRLFNSPTLPRVAYWALAGYVLAAASYYWLTGTYEPGERVVWLPMRLNGPIFTSMLLVCFHALALPGWVRQRRWLELSIASTLLLALVGWVLQTRSGLVGIALLVLGTVAWALHNHRRLALVLGAAVAATAATAFLLSEVSPVVHSLIARGDGLRLELWTKLLPEWRDCGIWLGCGGAYEIRAELAEGIPINHPHNVLYSQAFYTGLPGALLLAGWIAASLLYGWRHLRPWAAYLTLSVLMLTFDGTLLVNNPDERWLLLLLPLGLIAGNQVQGHARKEH